MTEWERFKQRIIHHSDQSEAYARDAFKIVKKKKRRKQLMKFVSTGKGGKKFIKWLNKKKQKHILRIIDRILNEDGLMNELFSDPKKWGDDDGQEEGSTESGSH